jgi:hypothetical protein
LVACFGQTLALTKDVNFPNSRSRLDRLSKLGQRAQENAYYEGRLGKAYIIGKNIAINVSNLSTGKIIIETAEDKRLYM